MPFTITTPPDDEPVSLSEVKQHLRIRDGETSQDTLLMGLIQAVRAYGEQICRRAFCTQSWKFVFDKFPQPNLEVTSANWYGPAWGIGPGPLTVLPPSGRTGYEFFIPVSPLITVDSVKYIDAQTQVQTTLDPTQYRTDLVSEPGRITPAYGTTWPSTLNVINAVEVAVTAGYGQPSAVPEGIKRWMLLRIGALFENREEVAVQPRIVIVEMPFADGLLAPYRVVSY